MIPILRRATPPDLAKNPAAHSTVAGLKQRIVATRESIASAERKRTAIDAAIATRKAALQRLLAAAALHGAGAAPSHDA